MRARQVMKRTAVRWAALGALALLALVVSAGAWAMPGEAKEAQQQSGQAPPAAPTGLTATAGDERVTLRWNDPGDSGITGYEYRMRSAGVAWSAWTAVAGSGAATTSAVVDGLANGTEYRFKVRAVNADGASGAAPLASPWYVAATPAAPPPPPPPPAAVASVTVTRADGTLTASWDAVAGATSYHVTYTSDGGASWGLAAFDHAGTSIEIAADNAGTYVVGVRAKNAGGGSGWRNSAPAGPFTPPTPTPTPTPTPPATVASVTVTRADGSLTASWDAVSGATSYHVTYTSDGGASWGLAAFDHAGTSIEIAAGNAKTYVVGVRARNSAGGSGWRNSAPSGPYEPPPPSEPPATPAGLTATAGDGSVTLAWDDPGDDGISGYEYIARWTGVAWGPWTAIAGSDAATTSVAIEGLENGAEYRFKLRAVNAAGASGAAPGASPWYVAATPGPTLTAGEVTATSAVITLGNYSGAWYYRAEGQSGGGGGGGGASGASGGGGGGGVVCMGPVHGQQTTVTGLDPNTNYTITAYGDGQCGGGAVGASAQVMTLPPAPGAIAKPASAALFGGAELTWTAPAGVTPTAYQFQYRPCLVYQPQSSGCVTKAWKDDDGNGVLDTDAPSVPAWPPWGDAIHFDGHRSATVTVGAATSPYALSGLDNGVRYQLRMRALNTVGDKTSYGPWSPPTDDVWPNTQYFLRASGLTDTTATLTVGASSGSWHYTNWYYKEIKELVDTACSAGQTATSATLIGLTENTSYTYAAYVGSGCTDEFARVTFTTTSDDNLDASAITDTTATLTLTNHTGAWYVKRTMPAGGTCDTGETDFTHALTGLTPGTDYVYKSYTDSACTGTASATASFTTLPGKPAGVGATIDDSLTTGNVIASWTRPAGQSGALSYTVQHNANSTWNACTTVAATSDANLDASCTYSGPTSSAPNKVRVRSASGGADSPWVEASFVNRPRDLGAAFSGSGLAITWKKPESPGSVAYSYAVESSADGTTWTSRGTVASTTAADLSRAVTAAGTVAHVRVRALDGSANASAWVEATVSGPANVGAQVRGTTLYLRWEKPSGAGGAVSYGVECNDSATGTAGWASCHTESASGAAKFTASVSSKGSVKRVRVKATQSTVSVPLAVASVPALVPGLPATLTVTVQQGGGGTGGGATQIYWTKPAGSTVDYSYEVTCSDDGKSPTDATKTWTYCGATPYTVAAGSTLSVSFTDKTATTHVRVLAIHDNLRGPIATWPSAPTGLGAQIQGTTLKLRWDKPPRTAGAIAYTISCNDSATGTTGWDDTCGSVSATSAGAVTASVANKGSVKRVRVRNTALTLADAWAVAAVPSGVPGAVAGLGAQVQGTTLKLRWERPGGAATALSYAVECNDAATGTTGWSSCHTESATSASLLTASVSNKGSVKRVRVRAERDGLQGAWTAGAVPSGLPGAPTNVTLSIVGTSGFAEWRKPAGETGTVTYRVDCSDDDGATWDLCGQTPSSHHATYAYFIRSADLGANALRVRVERDGLRGPWAYAPVALETSALTSTGATLSLRGYTSDWHYQANTGPDSVCQGPVTAGAYQSSATLTVLTGGVTYTYKAYRDSACSATKLIATATFTPPGLRASGITGAGATLTVAGHSGAWSHKRTAGPSDMTCANVATGATAALTNLTADTLYGYTAYSGAGCTAANALATVHFSTAAYGAGNLDEAAAASGCAFGYPVSSNNQCAVAFTTGPASGGYTLASVTGRFRAKNGSPAAISVAIHAADTTNSANPAATALVALSGSDPDAAGLHTYTCSGAACVLPAGTTYFVVMSTADTTFPNYYTWALTDSDAETAHPAANGWTIANAGRAKVGAAAWTGFTGGSADAAPMIHVVARAAPALTVAGLETTATLSLANYRGAWYYKATAGPDATCQGPVASGTQTKALTGLSPNTAYTYSAYSASGCANADLIAAASAFTTGGSVVSASNLTQSSYGNATIQGSFLASGPFTTGPNPGGYTLNRVVLNMGAADTAPGTLAVKLHATSGDNPASASLATLTLQSGNPRNAGQAAYACSGSGCSLAANTKYHVVLSSSGGTGTDQYRFHHVNGFSLTRTPSDNGWSYSLQRNKFGAWQSAGGAPMMQVSATAKIGLAASNVASARATLTLSEYREAWWYQGNQSGAACTPVTAGASTVNLAGLTASTPYTYTAYNASGCASGNEMATAAFTTTATTAALTASGVSDTGATLTIAWHAGQWWYQADTGPDATCQGPVAAGTATRALTGLTGATTYTYSAYSATGCANANLLATASAFTTPALTASGVSTILGIARATLRLTGHTGLWSSKRTAPSPAGGCTDHPIGGDRVFPSSLTAGVAYTYTAYSGHGCATANAIASVTFTTPATEPENVGAQVRDINTSWGVSENDKLQVWWDNPANATAAVGYEVECSSDNGSTWSDCYTQTASAADDFLVTPTFTGTANKVRVRATVDTRNSPWATADVPSGTAPGVPTGVGHTRQYNPSRYDLRWTKPTSPSGAVGYEIQCQDSNQSWWVCHTRAATTDTSLTHTTSTVYWAIRIRSIADGLVSDWVSFK